MPTPTATRPSTTASTRKPLHLATRLILSDEEACKTSIAEAVRRDLLWLAPRGRTVDIRISRPDVKVTLGEAAEAAS